MKILVVEDEPQMRMGLVKNMKFEGYEVDESGDGIDGLEKIQTNDYDMIILDIMLPGMSGFDICRKTREAGNMAPIIMLTARGEEIDRILGLELGADDYITKPFSLRELLTRIKVILRRCGNGMSSEAAKIGYLDVNFSACTVFDPGGEKVPMTYREFEILKYLWNNRNKTVSRDDLLSNVWGDNEIVTPRTIDNFISRLRHKIEKNPEYPEIILTFHKVGYKLVK